MPKGKLHILEEVTACVLFPTFTHWNATQTLNIREDSPQPPMGDQSSNLWGLPDSYRSILSRHNNHPKGCNCISIVNTGTGKSHFVQLFWFVLCSRREHWSIITEPECCCNPSVGMVTAVHKWRKSTEISGFHSHGTEAKVGKGIRVMLWLWSDSFPLPVPQFLLLNLLRMYMCYVALCLRLLCCLQKWCNPQMLWEWEGLSSLFLTGSYN